MNIYTFNQVLQKEFLLKCTEAFIKKTKTGWQCGCPEGYFCARV